MRERFKVSQKVLAMVTRRNSDINSNSNNNGGNNSSGYGSIGETATPTSTSSTVAPLAVAQRAAMSSSLESAFGSRSDIEADIGGDAEGSVRGSSSRGDRGGGDGDGCDSPVEDSGPSNTHPIWIQLNDIWETVQLKSVWRPMLFVYTYNLFQIPNVAWQSYLQLTLHFPPWILGLTVILGSFMTFAGLLAYKNYFFKTSWRNIYIGTMLLTTFFSLMQLVLIFQLNTRYLHLSNYFFSLGDDVISAYITGIQFLPVCIMYMRLCPDGAEGASYSMLTTFGNIALVCASNLGNLLSDVWDVSNSSLRDGDVSGLWKLSLLTSALALLPILWLHLLPNSADEQEELAKSKERSRPAGIIFLTVLFGSLAWTSISAIMRITGNL